MARTNDTHTSLNTHVERRAADVEAIAMKMIRACVKARWMAAHPEVFSADALLIANDALNDVLDVLTGCTAARVVSLLEDAGL